METVLMRGKPVADVYREAIAKKIAVAKQHDLVVTLAIWLWVMIPHLTYIRTGWSN